MRWRSSLSDVLKCLGGLSDKEVLVARWFAWIRWSRWFMFPGGQDGQGFPGTHVVQVEPVTELIQGVSGKFWYIFHLVQLVNVSRWSWQSAFFQVNQ